MAQPLPEHALAASLPDLTRLREVAAGPGGDDAARLIAAIEQQPAIAALMARVFAVSPFLRSLVEREPGWTLRVLTGKPEPLLSELTEPLAQLRLATDEVGMMRELRHARARAALLVGFADLSGAWDLVETTHALSRFADVVLQSAVDWLLADAHRAGTCLARDPARPAHGSGYAVIAMGKYGACELNYSSDIDLIVLYDEDRASLADGVEAPAFFVRLTKRLVKLLQERTADGYVFRVDLRLRPDPRATQIAISLEAAAQYYEHMGQNWERAAMIKARFVAGDEEAASEFLDRMVPFVWRKYLDFAAIADVQSLKRQIHAIKGHGRIAIAGHNIKLGRGGIREIEFFVQTQQLIAGGRAPQLRGRRTLDMLVALAEAGWITRAAADELAAAYVFLRTVEHRLQMIADEQTHVLPAADQDLERLARFAGYDGAAEFSEVLLGHLETVQRHYAALFEDAPGLGREGSLVFTGGEDDPETLQTLGRMGYKRPAEVAAAIRGWHFGRFAATRSARARERLTEITPVLLDALARTGQPDAAFVAFDRFLAGLPAGVQLFSLLWANPKLLDLLAGILGTAPRLARFLSRRPKIFDAVLDPGFFGPLPSRAELDELVRHQIPDGLPYEDVLDRARIVGNEQAFRIGVRILADPANATAAGAAYSALAEALIVRLLKAVRLEIEAVHGTLPDAAVTVVAMGKLGGGEMTATSDLDLLLIYDHDLQAGASDGPRPLSPLRYFSRLTQRLISALTAPTVEGGLYEVDMRLRPSGRSGPVASRIDSFVDYHRSSAWTWEKLALTRARVVAGDPQLASRVEDAIRRDLTTRRDAEALLADVHDMRQRLTRDRPARGRWDIKLAPGGLLDLEFIVQTLQLLHAPAHPEVLDQNTETALQRLTTAGVIDAGTGEMLIGAVRLYHALTQVTRLCVEGDFDPVNIPAGLEALLQQTAGEPDFASLEGTLDETMERVKDVLHQVIGRVS